MSHSQAWKVFEGGLHGEPRLCAAKWAAGFPALLPGAGLKLLRECMDLSRGELAGYLGVAERRVARWENGKPGSDPMAERSLRVLYLNSIGDRTGFDDIRQMLEQPEDLWPWRVRLEQRPTGWRVTSREYRQAEAAKKPPRARPGPPKKRLGLRLVA
jgi:DNA-binding transcriptional regulator YiaG